MGHIINGCRGLPFYPDGRCKERRKRRLAALPVPDVPNGYMDAAFWYLSFHRCLYFKAIRARRRQRFLTRWLGFDERTARDTMRLHAGLVKLRGKLPYAYMVKHHRRYAMFLRQHQAALLRRTHGWRYRDQTPVRLDNGLPDTDRSAWTWRTGFDLELAAEAINVPLLTVRRWEAMYEAGELTDQAPELLQPWRVRKYAVRAQVREIRARNEEYLRQAIRMGWVQPVVRKRARTLR